MLHSTSSYAYINMHGANIAQTHVNSYLIASGDGLQPAAKILTITYNGANTPMTITTDTDLGELSSAAYGLENVAGTKTFSTGIFGNTGLWSVAIGYANYNTADYS